MSRMAMRKERLRGTGFGSADQPEHWALTDRSKMADGLRCAEFKGAGLESKVLGWLGYAARRWAQRCVIGWDRRRWPEDRWLERCWPERRWPERRRHLSMSKSRNTAGGRKTLLSGAESKQCNNGISANGGGIYQA